MQIFVTGTDTNVGKTVISAWLSLHLGAYYWKPIESCEGDYDSNIVQKLTKLDNSKIIQSRYSFKNPVSPHLAAEIENVEIEMSELKLPNASPLIIEGAGGVMVPINKKYKVIDVIQKFNISTIIVTRSSLGTINHTCLTIESLRNRNIPILGVIMNGEKNNVNKEAIEKYGDVAVLSEFKILKELNFSTLKEIMLPSSILKKESIYDYN